MEESIFNAALAGLLHDVGKIVQRARPDPWVRAQGTEGEGQPVHATWSMAFIQSSVPKPYQAAALPGAYHHQPERSPAANQALSRLIALADHLSAGERADLGEENKQVRPPRQMVSIFDHLHLSKVVQPSPSHYRPLSLLHLDESTLFPVDRQSEDDQGQAYDRLKTFLEGKIKQDTGDRESYLENVLSALQQAAWCVPSAYYHSLPDISLYDHLRMTAALAVCLSELEDEKIKALLEADQRKYKGQSRQEDDQLLDSPLVLLVGGDISGIQDFIYTISSKGAAKTLRGRSFYLQLLTEAILRYLLKELGLPYTNVIYSGGGHFYLLAPLSAASKLLALKQYVTRSLQKHHATDLYLAVSAVEVPASGFGIGHFPEYWNKMHARLRQAKMQRYTELSQEDYHHLVFEPQPHGGNQEATCSVCGQESQKVSGLNEGDPGARICTLCESFDSQIGGRLPETDFIVLSFGDPQEQDHGTAMDVLVSFGMSVNFLGKRKKQLDLSGMQPKPYKAVVWSLGDAEVWPQISGVPAAPLLRYTVNRKLKMTFDELQDKAHGIHRLGVLRMDLDNLGELFSAGFKEKATLTRVATLSFAISLYFEGWVKHLCEHYPSEIYTVYSGGDDLFLIGLWDQVPALARTIAADFDRYTESNPDLHISGGMTFIHGKYPVYQAAADAQGAVDKAKAVLGKNAFTFLDQAWPWDKFDLLTRRYERLLRIVGPEDEGGLAGPQALIQLLRRFAQNEADKARSKRGRPVWGPWMWQGDYQLTRMRDRVNDNKELKAELESLLAELQQSLYQDIAVWGTAARWAQLWLREGEERK